MWAVRQTGQASSATQNSWKACPHSNTTSDDDRPTLSASGSVQHSHEPEHAHCHPTIQGMLNIARRVGNIPETSCWRRPQWPVISSKKRGVGVV